MNGLSVGKRKREIRFLPPLRQINPSISSVPVPYHPQIPPIDHDDVKINDVSFAAAARSTLAGLHTMGSRLRGGNTSSNKSAGSQAPHALSSLHRFTKNTRAKFSLNVGRPALTPPQPPMSSVLWPPAAGASPAPPLEAAADAAIPASASATTSEQHPVKEGGGAATAAVVQEEEEAKPQFPRDDDSEVEIQEHEQKINKYQAILAAHLKAKYFSYKAFDGGNIFEAETIVEGETIQSSRWPCTSSFANPVIFFRDKNSHERSDSPSLAADSSAKNNSPSVAAEASPKNNASALATENNLTPGKRAIQEDLMG